MKKFDLIIISVFIFIGFAGLGIRYLGSEKSKGVEIYVDGELYETRSLPEVQEEITIETASGVNILTLYPDGIKMTYANCSSQVCVNTPKQSISGGTVVCLPHRVLVRVIGGTNEGVDVIAN